MRAIAKNRCRGRGGLDVVIHNAGHMVFGPAEAFTPRATRGNSTRSMSSAPQRVNRGRKLRKQGKGLLVWVSSSSFGRPALLHISRRILLPKAAMDAMAVVYGARTHALGHRNLHQSCRAPFTGGTNHFAHSGFAARCGRVVAEYEAGPYKGFGCANPQPPSPRSWPPEADASSVGGCGRQGSSMRRSAKRPFRVSYRPRPKMAPTSRSPSIDRVPQTRCCIVSDFPTCSSRGPTAEVFKSAARDASLACRSLSTQPVQHRRVHLAGDSSG